MWFCSRKSSSKISAIGPGPRVVPHDFRRSDQARVGAGIVSASQQSLA